MGSPDERVFHPNFLSSSTPLPYTHIQSHEQPSSSQLRNENPSERSMTQIISDSARSNQSSSRILRESTRFKRWQSEITFWKGRCLMNYDFLTTLLKKNCI